MDSPCQDSFGPRMSRIMGVVSKTVRSCPKDTEQLMTVFVVTPVPSCVKNGDEEKQGFSMANIENFE